MSIYSNIFDEVEQTYEGCVLKVWEKKVYNETDFMALVWDEETQSVQKIIYDSTRALGWGSANVDVTPEVARKVYNYYKKQAINLLPLYIEHEKNSIQEGSLVKIYKGNRLRKGTIGKVFWVGESFNQYTNCFEERVGMLVSGKHKIYIPKSYVKILKPNDIHLNRSQRKKVIEEIAYNKCPGWVQYVLDKKVNKSFKEKGN